LKLAYFNGTGWEISTLTNNVQVDGGQGSPGYMQLFNDYVYITYTTANGDLAAITNAPQGFVDEPSLNVLGIIIFMLIIVYGRWSMVHGKSY